MLLNLQPTHLKNDWVTLLPLQKDDFEKLYQVASDPLIWAQHPSQDRYKKEVFQLFFESAIQSESAFLIFDTQSNELIGSTRFYDFDATAQSIAIGYTFLAKKYWGTGHNGALKSLMLDYIFEYVNHVIFHVGATNIRSQKAVEKLGAKKINELDMGFASATKTLYFVYQISKKAP
jgi:RimJ/RimL family protein N-acetyltransferase